MKCPNCKTEIPDSIAFKYVRKKRYKREPVVCAYCGEELDENYVLNYTGKVGGSVTSVKKRKAVRRNGILGGRPKRKIFFDEI